MLCGLAEACPLSPSSSITLNPPNAVQVQVDLLGRYTPSRCRITVTWKGARQGNPQATNASLQYLPSSFAVDVRKWVSRSFVCHPSYHLGKGRWPLLVSQVVSLVHGLHLSPHICWFLRTLQSILLLSQPNIGSHRAVPSATAGQPSRSQRRQYWCQTDPQSSVHSVSDLLVSYVCHTHVQLLSKGITYLHVQYAVLEHTLVV